ncbi:reverse transcriptase [Senna tora]|uniref:Reverse transcriptase n=1 Tax=Senna tora TaxID=362788 RepID=A0A835C9S6_9FABA|nr:reverse transcriptase [Senna tora]
MMMSDKRGEGLDNGGYEQGAKSANSHDGDQLSLVVTEEYVSSVSDVNILKEVQNIMGKENVAPSSKKCKTWKREKNGREVKRNSSYTWQGLMAGRDILKQHLIRCIGDGRQTRIWEDPWIPGRLWLENGALLELISGVECVVDKVFWQKIWKLPILPKYRVFMWRACLGILPTANALQSRGVMVDDQFIFCNTEEEDAYHTLVSCTQIQPIWRAFRLAHHNSLLEWLIIEGGGWSKEQWGMLSIALSMIWDERNRRKFTEQRHDLSRIWLRAAAAWDEFSEVGMEKGSTVISSELVSWAKPEPSWSKLNADAGTCSTVEV